MLVPNPIALRGNASFAMNELRDYLARCAGAVFSDDGFPIELVATDAGQTGALADEGYTIAVAPDHIRIESPSLRGVAYGVYAFLERFCGCAFLADDCELAPERGALEVEPGVYESKPDFAYRDVYWRGALDGRFALKLGLNSARADIAPEMGGRVRFFNYSHTFADLVPPDRWFDEHPEYFSLVDGQRRREHSQLCLTDPDVLRLCVEGVKRWIAENPDCRIFSVAQNDWYGNCECARCREIDRREGSAAGSLIAFVNAVADEIAKEHPGVLIHTFAYLYSRKAPKTLRPRDNVIVRLCSIECCFSHPIGSCDHAIAQIDVEEGAARTFSTQERGFADDLRDWSRIAKRLYIWDYTTNYRHYLLPFPNLRVLAPNIRLFREYGVSGVFEQGNYSPGRASAFAPLKIYLLGKLLWDADADVDVLTRRFVACYYGERCADAMLAALGALQAAADRAHMGIFDEPTADYLNDDVLERAGALMDSALALADTDAHRERIARERLSVTYAQLVRLPMDSPGRPERIERFQRDAERLGIGELFERRELQASFESMKSSRYARNRASVPYRVYRL